MINVDHFEALEARSVRLRVNLRAGFHAVKKALREGPEYQDFLEAYEGFDDAVRITNRALALAERNVDPRFENPADVALLAYLLLLEGKEPNLARYVADRLLETPSLAWAGREAREVLKRSPWQNEGADSESWEPEGVATDQSFYETGERSVTAAFGHRQLAAASAAGVTGRPRGPATEAKTINRLLRKVPVVWHDTGPSSGAFEDREI